MKIHLIWAQDNNGGIGVSGGDWQQDEDIARAAVEAIGASYEN